MSPYKIAISLFLIGLLSACQTAPSGTDGSVGNSILRKPSATDGLAAGPLSGALGEGLSRSVLNKALSAELTALQTGLAGSSTKWSDPSGVSGKVIPGQIYEVGASTCRRYQHQINVDGTTRNGEGTACKGENGLWTALI